MVWAFIIITNLKKAIERCKKNWKEEWDKKLVTKKKLIKNKPSKSIENKEKDIKPTRKATLFAQKYNLDINKLGLKGLVKEKDLYPFIKKNYEHIFL